MHVISLDEARQRRAEPSLSPATGLFTTADGASIYYEDSGGPGPALFYIYGLGCSIQHWKYPLAYFSGEGAAARPRRQVWLDFRGHGHSGAVPAGSRLLMDTIVEDIASLCAYRRIRQASFLGQSMGGVVALKLAHQHPELVRALVLLASPGRDPGRFLPLNPVSGALWKGLIGLNRRLPLAVKLGHLALTPALKLAPVKLTLRELVRQSGFNPELARTDDIDEYIAKVFEVKANLFFDMAGDLAGFDVAQLVPRIACPALIVAGVADKVIPLGEARRLARHLPESELVTLPHGSHCPHFDDPTSVNQMIEAFLEKHHL